ncbi:hypothetical protein [Pseudomonas sp. LB3P14]
MTLQLRLARQNIFKLVEMHAEVTQECGTLRTALQKTKADLVEFNRRATDIEMKSNWELMVSKHISELPRRLIDATGKDPRTGLPTKLSR